MWCGPNSPGIICASHARAKLGATTVPVNYRLTPEETAYIVEDSDAVLVYADAEQAETFARIRGKIPRVRDIVIFGGAPLPGLLDGDALIARASDAEPPPTPGDHPQSMLYTSGTTGRPKGAVRPPPDPAAIVPILTHVGFAADDVYRRGRSITPAPAASCRSRTSWVTPRSFSGASTRRTGCGSCKSTA